MYDIQIEDWDCIFNLDDPDFEYKFTELMRKYLENAKIRCKEHKNKKEKKEWEDKLRAIEFFLNSKNWLISIPTDTKLVLSEKDRDSKNFEYATYFQNILTTIGMMGENVIQEKCSDEKFGYLMFDCFEKILVIQQERAKKQGIRGILAKITDV